MSEGTERDGRLFTLEGEAPDAEKEVIIHDKVVIENRLDDGAAKNHSDRLYARTLTVKALGDDRVELLRANLRVLTFVGTRDKREEEDRRDGRDRDPYVLLFGPDERFPAKIVINGLVEEAFEIIYASRTDGVYLGDTLHVSIIGLVPVRILGCAVVVPVFHAARIIVVKIRFKDTEKREIFFFFL